MDFCPKKEFQKVASRKIANSPPGLPAPSHPSQLFELKFLSGPLGFYTLCLKGEESESFHCLNRGDLSPITIFHNSANAKKTRFPLLNNELEFNQTGFWCDEEKDIFLQWTVESMDKLWQMEIPDCTLRNYGSIDARILVRLLLNDRSFKGRKIVDDIDIDDDK